MAYANVRGDMPRWTKIYAMTYWDIMGSTEIGGKADYGKGRNWTTYVLDQGGMGTGEGPGTGLA